MSNNGQMSLQYYFALLLGDSIFNGAGAEYSPPCRLRSSQLVDVCQCPTRHRPARQLAYGPPTGIAQTPSCDPARSQTSTDHPPTFASPGHGFRAASRWQVGCSACAVCPNGQGLELDYLAVRGVFASPEYSASQGSDAFGRLTHKFPEWGLLCCVAVQHRL